MATMSSGWYEYQTDIGEVFVIVYVQTRFQIIHCIQTYYYNHDTGESTWDIPHESGICLMTRRESPGVGELVSYHQEDPESIEEVVEEEEENEVEDMLPDISRLGFTTDMLKHFMEECGGREFIAERSVAYMCQYYVKRFTNARKLTYCEELTYEPECAPFIGHATILIVYSSQANFLAIADILVKKYAGTGFIWWDMFCRNHHTAPTATYSSDWCVPVSQHRVRRS
jgi:hypothetical protein